MLFFSVLSAINGFAQSKPKATYPYLLYLPKDYANTAKNYPVIVYLHGSSHRGTDLNKLKGYGLPYLIDKGQDFDFIIVSPQCPSEKYWFTDNWFDALYTELKMQYRIDTARLYLTGISMGGGGTFEVAKDFPDTFAALVPLCPWRSDTSRICQLNKVPIWTFHGTADDIVPVAETEEKVKALQKCHGDITYTPLENDGHGIQWLYEKQGKHDIYQWMLKHSK